MKNKYEVGDEAWIYMRNHKGEKTKSTVVHEFTLYRGKRYYVCEVPTSVDPLLEVRDCFSMAESEGSGIGLYELIKEELQ